jgi:hypothetical protein
VLSTYYLPFEEIPIDYLPLSSFFCPELNFKFSFEFGISLKGKLADLHEAVIKSAYSVTNSVASLIEEALDSLNDFKLKPQILQQASSDGSFKINLKVKFLEYNNFFISEDEISEYVNKYLSYCVEDLPNEIERLTNNNSLDSDKFASLSKSAENLYLKAAMTYNQESRERLKADVIDSLPKVEKLAEEVGNGFKEIEILGKIQENKSEIPIAFLDENQTKKISQATEFMLSNSSDSTQDEEDKVYSICIYHLNTDTRVGNAYIYSDEDKSTMDKPKIEILGDEELSGTNYTESLHLNKWIDVTGRAQKYKDKFKRISIKGNFKE